VIRIIGVVLIMTSTAAMGFAGVRRLKNRVVSLDAIITSLDVMESEICSRLAPMREVLEQLSSEAPEPARRLYANALKEMERLGRCSFYTIWRDSVDKTRELMLNDDEKGTLEELGLCLGRYDVKEQSESIRRVRRKMERFLDRAEEQRRRDSKLHAFFGVVSGIFAVIILL
jgi:stage III sporulation protein AB